MKRLFRRFEKETGLVTHYMTNPEIKNHKIRIQRLSQEFNAWLDHLWNTTGPVKKPRYGFGVINTFMIRKWYTQMLLS